MSALRWGQESRKGAGRRPAFGAFPSFGRFVLPRWLRRPVRLIARLGEDDFSAPPFSAAVHSAMLLASSATYGGYLGGHLDGFVQGVTARTGFAVDQIKVVGNRQTSEIDVLDKLGLDGWTSLIGFDAEAARERIASLPWVEQAAVRKVYPHTLEVRVDERQAFAIWQQGRELSVIEKDGRIIAPYSGGKQADLPLLVGTGAPQQAPDLMARIGRYPELAARVKGSGAGMEPPPEARLVDGWFVWRPHRAPMPEVVLGNSGMAGEWRLCADGRCRALSRILGHDVGAHATTMRACD